MGWVFKVACLCLLFVLNGVTSEKIKDCKPNDYFVFLEASAFIFCVYLSWLTWKDAEGDVIRWAFNTTLCCLDRIFLFYMC